VQILLIVVAGVAVGNGYVRRAEDVFPLLTSVTGLMTVLPIMRMKIPRLPGHAVMPFVIPVKILPTVRVIVAAAVEIHGILTRVFPRAGRSHHS